MKNNLSAKEIYGLRVKLDDIVDHIPNLGFSVTSNQNTTRFALLTARQSLTDWLNETAANEKIKEIESEVKPKKKYSFMDEPFDPDTMTIG